MAFIEAKSQAITRTESIHALETSDGISSTKKGIRSRIKRALKDGKQREVKLFSFHHDGRPHDALNENGENSGKIISSKDFHDAAFGTLNAHGINADYYREVGVYGADNGHAIRHTVRISLSQPFITISLDLLDPQGNPVETSVFAQKVLKTEIDTAPNTNQVASRANYWQHLPKPNPNLAELEAW